jgi:hypothetical protein
MPQLKNLGTERKIGICGEFGRAEREKAPPEGSAFLIKEEERVCGYVLSWNGGLNRRYGRWMPVSLILFSKVL